MFRFKCAAGALWKRTLVWALFLIFTNTFFTQRGSLKALPLFILVSKIFQHQLEDHKIQLVTFSLAKCLSTTTWLNLGSIFTLTFLKDFYRSCHYDAQCSDRCPFRILIHFCIFLISAWQRYDALSSFTMHAMQTSISGVHIQKDL